MVRILWFVQKRQFDIQGVHVCVCVWNYKIDCSGMEVIHFMHPGTSMSPSKNKCKTWALNEQQLINVLTKHILEMKMK